MRTGERRRFRTHGGVAIEPSQRRLSILTKIEAALTVFVGVLAVITIFWHDWIKALTGWDPDQHNGTFEIYIIIGLALIAVVLGLVTRVSWKRDRASRARSHVRPAIASMRIANSHTFSPAARNHSRYVC